MYYYTFIQSLDLSAVFEDYKIVKCALIHTIYYILPFITNTYLKVRDTELP